MRGGPDEKFSYTKKNKCLDCGYVVDAASAPGQKSAKPTPNDITVCLMCGHLMGFNKDMTVRPLTDAEMYEVAGDPRILKIQRARVAVVKDKGK